MHYRFYMICCWCHQVCVGLVLLKYGENHRSVIYAHQDGLEAWIGFTSGLSSCHLWPVWQLWSLDRRLQVCLIPLSSGYIGQCCSCMQLLWFHKVSNVQCSCRAWPWQTILRLVWLYHWPVTGQRDTSLCRGVSEPKVFLGCDEFCNYVRGPGKFLDSLGLQLHSCLLK